jgi:hypothetical protein
MSPPASLSMAAWMMRSAAESGRPRGNIPQRRPGAIGGGDMGGVFEERIRRNRQPDEAVRYHHRAVPRGIARGPGQLLEGQQLIDEAVVELHRFAQLRRYTVEHHHDHGKKDADEGFEEVLIESLAAGLPQGHGFVKRPQLAKRIKAVYAVCECSQRPYRRLRPWKARIARRKSTLRNAGQFTSEK